MNQPLILVKIKLSNDNIINQYFIPEFCFLKEFEEEKLCKDKIIMKEVNLYSKKFTNDIINIINQIASLFIDSSSDISQNSLSSKEKSDFFGIEIKPLNQKFISYYIKDPKLIGGNNHIIRPQDKIFRIF